MDRDHGWGRPQRGNAGWGQQFLTNPRIDPLSLDRYSQGEGRVDTHTLHLPPQESWASYHDTVGENPWRPQYPVYTEDSSTEALDTDEGKK